MLHVALSALRLEATGHLQPEEIALRSFTQGSDLFTKRFKVLLHIALRALHPETLGALSLEDIASTLLWKITLNSVKFQKIHFLPILK